MHFTIPFPDNEVERLKSLISYDILDALPDHDLDAITQLASYICNTPISLITLMDSERQLFKSKLGLDLAEISRNISFCQETIRKNELYIVPDLSKNELFKDNPIVKNEHILFYAGYPLRSPEGYSIGTICVLDKVPKNLNEDQKKALETLSKAVVAQFELKKRNISPYCIKKAMLEIDKDEYQQVLEKSLKALIKGGTRKELYAASQSLIRKGFEQDLVLQTLSSITNTKY